jgi:hypothetical protein
MGRNEEDYWLDLDKQIRLNQNQVDDLRDALLIERLKLFTYFIAFIILLSVAALITSIIISPNSFEILNHYAALINIGAVFMLFGLFEVLSFFSISLSLILKMRRLINRQRLALKHAKFEISERRGV